MALRGCHRPALLAFSCLAVAGILNAVAAGAVEIQAQPQTPIPVQTQTIAPSRHVGPSCISIRDAAGAETIIPPAINKDSCLSAHVYDVVELADGTRFLDVCPADVPDADCRFMLMSLRADRDDVGDLRRYRGQDISVRGTMRSMHGRMGIVISHARQFNGGPEKFKPNPKLLRDFNGQSDRMPVHDPNLASSGHHRSFMNTQDRETLPANRKP